MKKLYSCLLLIGFVCLLASCEKDTVDYGLGEYYVNIASYLGSDEFLLDDGTLLVNTGEPVSLKITRGQRVWLNYSHINESSSSKEIRVNGISLVMTGELQMNSLEVIKEMPTAPIDMESIWIGSHYINMIFRFEHYTQQHKIGMIADSSRIEDKTVDIYFTHDTNNDKPGYKSNTIVSFDLSTLLGDRDPERTLLVNINTGNYGKKTYNLKY